jgi:hypothetical protein
MTGLLVIVLLAKVAFVNLPTGTPATFSELPLTIRLGL